MSRSMAADNLSPEDILSIIESEYVSLMNTDEWPPAQNKVDPTAPPAQKFGNTKALTTANLDFRPNGNEDPGRSTTSTYRFKKRNGGQQFSKKSSSNKQHRIKSP